MMRMVSPTIAAMEELQIVGRKTRSRCLLALFAADLEFICLIGVFLCPRLPPRLLPSFLVVFCRFSCLRTCIQGRVICRITKGGRNCRDGRR